MYANYRLQALANKRVELELSRVGAIVAQDDTLEHDAKLAYLDEQIASAKELVGAEMATFVANATSEATRQIDKWDD